jgi:hypothetical protein
MSNVLLPEVGNLAWAPLTTIEAVEIFDRYNGVPTLGTVRAAGTSHLFWRAIGYTADVSLWLYVPLTTSDCDQIDDDEGPGIVDGIVFRSPTQRFIAVGVAVEHRLVFEREWRLPAGLQQSEILTPLLEFTSEALRMALDQDLPLSRRELMQRASEVVGHLVPN